MVYIIASEWSNFYNHGGEENGILRLEKCICEIMSEYGDFYIILAGDLIPGQVI